MIPQQLKKNSLTSSSFITPFFQSLLLLVPPTIVTCYIIMKSYDQPKGIQDSCYYVKPILQIWVPYYFKTGKKNYKIYVFSSVA